MNTQLIRSVLAIVISSVLFSCHKGGPWGIRGTGPDVTENWNIQGFDKIHLPIDADLYYTQDSVYKVEITAQQNILAVLKIEVQSGALTFDYRRNVWDHNKVKINVHSPNLNGISISGSGNVTVQNSLTTDALELNVSGSGNVNLPALNASSLKATISGSSDVKISGDSLGSETFNVSGVGNVDASGIVAQSCTIRVSGSGNVNVNVTGTLDVDISGVGNVRYHGNPAIQSSISGSGRLIHEN